MNTVLVFRTSVTKNTEVRQLRPFLDQLIRPAGKWNFDLEDCDRILRIEAAPMLAGPVRSLMKAHNHLCDELD